MTLRSRIVRVLPPGISWPMVAGQLGLHRTRLLSCQATALGFRFDLALHPPASTQQVEQAAHLLAVAYAVGRVRVVADPLRADRCSVYLDEQLALGSVLFPDAFQRWVVPQDPLRPFPLGVDDSGMHVAGRFYGQNCLIGGSPGSGKSMAMRVLLASLASSRHVQLYGIDPKHAELSMWSERFERVVLGNEGPPTAAMVEALLTEIQRRARLMASLNVATLQPSKENPWIVLVIDEWAEVAAAEDVKSRAAIAALIRRYVSLGRAVGCNAIICTQRPTSDSIDVGTRAMLGHRFALRCGDRHQAEAILGVGSFSPEQLLGAAPGRALWSDGGTAYPIQFYEIPDSKVPSLVFPGVREGTHDKGGRTNLEIGGN